MSKKKGSAKSKAGRDECKTVYAAGCLVYRETAGNGLEVLVAHRPLYDDWDFPKGKREKEESDLDCALRETKEETGFVGEVGAELESSRYKVGNKRKVVRWWLLRQTGGDFTENDEVDKIRWLSPEAAMKVVSYRDSQRLLAGARKHLVKATE